MITTDGALRAGEMQLIRCANNCDHDCDLMVTPGDWMRDAIRQGWTLVLWESDPADEVVHEGMHQMAFCDPGCLYEHWASRMLADPHWNPKLAEMNLRAADRAATRTEHRHA